MNGLWVGSAAGQFRFMHQRRFAKRGERPLEHVTLVKLRSTKQRLVSHCRVFAAQPDAGLPINDEEAKVGHKPKGFRNTSGVVLDTPRTAAEPVRVAWREGLNTKVNRQSALGAVRGGGI